MHRACTTYAQCICIVKRSGLKAEPFIRKAYHASDVSGPYLLLAPQLAISLVFFYWPAVQALRQSTLREDAVGLKTELVGMTRGC